MFTVAIQEWGLGLTVNPVQNIRKPSPEKGRNRRLTYDEEGRLFRACNQHLFLRNIGFEIRRIVSLIASI